MVKIKKSAKMRRQREQMLPPAINEMARRERWADFLSLTRTANLNVFAPFLRCTSTARATDLSLGLHSLLPPAKESVTYAVVRSDGYIAFLDGPSIEIEDIDRHRQSFAFEEGDEDEWYEIHCDRIRYDEGTADA
jgi:hypothetical protein